MPAAPKKIKDVAPPPAPVLVAGTVSRVDAGAAWATFEDTGGVEFPLLGVSTTLLAVDDTVLVGRDQHDRTWLLAADRTPTNS